MSDCFYGACCISCSSIQLLNEVSVRGSRMKNIKPANDFIQKYENILTHTPMCFDSISRNIDCICVCVNTPCETASIYSNVTGTPLWLSCLSNINICQLNHIIRQEYNVAGDEFQNDIIIPLVFSYTTLETIRNMHVSNVRESMNRCKEIPTNMNTTTAQDDEIIDLFDDLNKK